MSDSTTDAIAVTPVRRVGSGTGANRLECSDGSGAPVARLYASRYGAVAPPRKRTVGIS